MAKSNETAKRGRRSSVRSTPKVTRTARKPLRPPAKRTIEKVASAPVVLKSQKLQKVLAQAGLGSRRAMEEAITEGKVKVNDKLATLGQRVTSQDLIMFGRRRIQFKVTTRLPRVILYHKPEGEIVTRDDPKGRTSVFEKLPTIRSAKWLAVGRLDYNTCGLLIFTTSGDLANRLMHPRFEVEREYAVRIFGTISNEQANQLRTGVRLSDGMAHFELLEAQGGEGRNHWYRVVLREGRNRVVRRMFESLGLQVSRLMRIRFGIVALPPALKRGTWIECKESEIRSLLDWGGSDGADTPDEDALPEQHAAQPARSGVTKVPGSSARKRPGSNAAKPRKPSASKPGSSYVRKSRKSSAESRNTKSSPAAVSSHTKRKPG